MEAIFYEKKHFFWSHLEVRNLHPAHFILLPAHCSSYDICILCRAGTLIAWKCLQICCQKKQVVKKREKKRGHYVWLPQSQHGAQSCVFIAFAQSEWFTPPYVCLQPTAAMLIIWRSRWASLTLWWRPSVGCCCSLWARTPKLDRGHEMLKKVCSTKLNPHHRLFSMCGQKKHIVVFFGVF